LRLGQATGQPDASVFFLGQISCVRYEQGRLGEMERALQEALAAYPGLPTGVHTLLALLYCETDRLETARSHYEAVTGDDFASIPEDNVWVFTMIYIAAVCAYLNDAPRAAVLYRALQPYADQFAFTTGAIQGGIVHHLGVLATVSGQFAEAEAHYAAAEAMHQRMGAPIWLARTRLEWARMLLTRRQPGDAERAQEFLGSALATARERGAGSVERRAVELLS
jgi:tetratricopeptide (TPR) repeat protein